MMQAMINLYYKFNENEKKMSKSFLRRSRKSLLEEILINIFHEPRNETSAKNKVHLLQLIFKHLGVPDLSRKISLSIIEKKEITEMINSIKKQPNLPSKLLDIISRDDFWVIEQVLLDFCHLILDNKNSSNIKDEFEFVIYKIWDDLANLLLNIGKNTDFDIEYCYYSNNFYESKLITDLKELLLKYDYIAKYKLNFNCFVGVILNYVHILFIEECKQYVVNLCHLESNSSDVSLYQTLCFSGASLNSLHVCEMYSCIFI